MILQKSFPLNLVSNYKIGGPADYFFEFDSFENLLTALLEYKEIDSDSKSIFILGKGTNVLFSDKGFRGLVLKNSLSNFKRNGEFIDVGSGILVKDFLEHLVLESLSGFEWAGGLPGTIGGAIRGNAGAYGGETTDNLAEVTSLDLDTFGIKTSNNSECKFEYRNSIFKSGDANGEIILSAKFELSSGNQNEIKRKTQEKIDHRLQRHPLEYPNIGSTFKNIPVEEVPEQVLKDFEGSIKQDPFPVLPVAKLIASTDLVGKKIGGAQISTKHPNFIVNLGEAKASDVLALIDIIKKELKEKFGVEIEEEIMIV